MSQTRREDASFFFQFSCALVPSAAGPSVLGDIKAPVGQLPASRRMCWIMDCDGAKRTPGCARTNRAVCPSATAPRCGRKHSIDVMRLNTMCNGHIIIILNILSWPWPWPWFIRCIGSHVDATNVCLELMLQPLPRLIPFFGGPSLPHLSSSSLACQVFAWISQLPSAALASECVLRPFSRHDQAIASFFLGSPSQEVCGLNIVNYCKKNTGVQTVWWMVMVLTWVTW